MYTSIFVVVLIWFILDILISHDEQKKVIDALERNNQIMTNMQDDSQDDSFEWEDRYADRCSGILFNGPLGVPLLIEHREKNYDSFIIVGIINNIDGDFAQIEVLVSEDKERTLAVFANHTGQSEGRVVAVLRRDNFTVLKTISNIELPLFIGWPYILPHMAEILKNEEAGSSCGV